uniref:Uncharacterized protein n=1 Tax=Rhizophora mucronata TaxID=61149 RepID=A0A2P2MID2_RHIMU
MFQEMGFGAFRSMIRPLSRTLVSHTSPTPFSAPKPEFRFGIGGGGLRQGRSLWAQVSQHFSIFAESSHFDRLTDTRFPKRRPLDKPRRKRASLRPPGPYAWTQYVPGEPIQPNNPNEGSLKRRKEKKRMRQRRAFILVSDCKKRKIKKRKKKIMSNLISCTIIDP